MARIDIERKLRLEPIRTEKAINELSKLGFNLTEQTTKLGTKIIYFHFKGSGITFYPYSGWHTGKTK